MPSGAQESVRRVRVDGMRCEGCVTSVHDALAGVDGVSSASVDLATKSAQVTAAAGVSAGELQSAVAAAGFSLVEDEDEPEPTPPGAPTPLEPMRDSGSWVELAIDGMTCAGCVHTVEEALRRVEGVVAADVNFAARSASVEFSGRDSDLVAAVRRAGYSARVAAEADAADDDTELAALRGRLFVSALFTVPALVLAMSGGALAFAGSEWVQLVLTLVVLAYGGSPIFAAAGRALMHGTSNMNTLVAVGTTAAFGFSLVVTISAAFGIAWRGRTAGVFYETAAVIITLVLLGRFLETRARVRAGGALRALADRQPRHARVVRDGVTRDIPVGEVAVGDIVEVRPGDTIAVDGTVVGGASAVEESMLTGESVPVDKAEGDHLAAGTRNTTGTLRFRATAVGDATVLGQIIAMVRRAQGSKAPIARVADRVSAVFVPVVIALALVTAAIWWLVGDSDAALVNAIAVLIIACPCALGLATPAALMVGIGRAASSGILIRDAAILEQLAGVDTVVLDKTGTLTSGRPRVVEIVPAVGYGERDVLEAASAVERASEHPLAEAIVAEAGVRGWDADGASEFSSHPGFGVQADWRGDRWRVAKPLDAPEPVARLRSAGATVAEVTRNDAAVGWLALRDEPKADARDAVAALRAMSLDVHMLSGDHQSAAEALAERTGIAHVRSGVLPAEKAEYVESLHATGRSVAMAGDGLNDAPALAAADVGIALGSGTDVAVESADVVIPGERMRAIPDVVELARQTFRTIRQNLFWAFAYNAVGIPLAAGVLYPATGWLLSPMVASAAMAASSLSVVLNSLRLRTVRLAR